MCLYYLLGIQITSPYATSKGITQGDVIGTGANHIITSHHLEQREAAFNHAHSHLARYLSKESQETMYCCSDNIIINM